MDFSEICHVLAERLPDPVMIYDSTGSILYVNTPFCLRSGYSEKELLKMTPDTLFRSGKKKSIAKKWFRKSSFKAFLKIADGSEFAVDIDSEHISGKGDALFLAIIKESDKKLPLLENLRLFRELIDNASDMIFIIDPATSIILDSNKAASDILMIPKDEILGRKVIELSHDFNTQEIWDKHVADMKKWKQQLFRSPIPCRDGSEIMTEVNSRYLKLSTSEFIIANIRDISEQYETEKMLIERDNLYHQILEKIPVRFLWKDLDLNYQGGSRVFAEHLGLKSPSELIGKNDFDLFDKIIADRIRSEDKSILTGKKEKINKEESFVDKNGMKHWFIANKLLLRNSNEEIQGLIGTYEDITPLKNLLNQLREEIKFNENIINTASSFIVILDIDGKIKLFNHYAEQLTGYSSKEVLNKNWFNLFLPKSEKGRMNDIFVDIIDGVQPYAETENTILCRDKSEMYMLWHNSMMKDEHGEVLGMLSIGVDITARKKMEKSLLRLSAAIEHADELIVITDTDGILQYVNPCFEKVTGYSRDEAIGKSTRILKSGRQNADFYKNLWRRIEAGKVWSGHFINRKKNGELYEEDAVISPVKDEDGKITGYVGVKRDVTEEMAKEKLLSDAQKMDAMDHLASGIAHDFNSILMIISSNAELAENAIDSASSAHDDLMQIRHAVKRGRNLTEQLMMFSRKQQPATEILDVRRIILDTLNMLMRILPADIVIDEHLADSSCYVKMDAGQLEQILINLAINARDAMPDGGTITVRSATVELREKNYTDYSLMGTESFKPGAYCKITFSDNGEGIEENALVHIFEPLFTTKKRGHGTGFGLSTVFGIIKQHRGYISVESKPGKGTVFRLYLPIYKEDSAEDAS